MDNFTAVQKKVIINLSAEFYPRLLGIVERGGQTDLYVKSDQECAVLKSFMDMIVDSVYEKYPDNEDINDDAVLSVFIGSQMLNDYVKQNRG